MALTLCQDQVQSPAHPHPFPNWSTLYLQIILQIVIKFYIWGLHWK